ncbi:MAG: glucosaminidase domain-containing protein [Sneathiella sp.]|uniref:glucosaminidase domain-containing protein n=1 Tax=Sneathiella sp. TaxID=1964365 RepID=UPI0030025C3B
MTVSHPHSSARFLPKYGLLLIVMMCAPIVPAQSAELIINDYTDVEAYFEREGFTQESWKAGGREVPNFSFKAVGETWRSETVPKIDVPTKKRLFFRALAPFGLKANNAVMVDRTRLLNLSKASDLSAVDQSWLVDLALRYRVMKEPVPSLSSDQLTELTRRVDIVPLSLILAQSAEESGWGTSRFTAEGNSLFGQWSWGKDAMIPKQQRKELGNYGLASFDTVLEAVKSYVHNLNSGTAYKQLRQIRYDLRKKGEDVRGKALSEGLSKYSERGADYVKGIQAIMRINKLADADYAYLADEEETVFIPAKQ